MRKESIFGIGLGIAFILAGFLIADMETLIWAFSGSLFIVIGLVHEWAMRGKEVKK